VSRGGLDIPRIVLEIESGILDDGVMATHLIQPGDRVMARNAFGEENERRAVTGVMEGQDFPVVWVSTEEEWHLAANEGREPEGIPFPAEDVRPT
jgi:hypothetical protein